MSHTRSIIAEPSAEEYEEIKKNCQGLLIQDGGKYSLAIGTLATLGLYVFSKTTSLGKRLTIHPYALLATSAYVAPFWIVGEKSVLDCQRGAYERRKEIVRREFEGERFNKQ